MKTPDFTLSFLDMVFSLFAVLAMLVVLLAVIKGSADYEIEGDFIVARIVWRESVWTHPSFNQILSEPNLVADSNPLADVLKSSSNSTEAPTGAPCTILVLANVTEKEYKISSANGTLMNFVEITTKAGKSLSDPPSQGTPIEIQVRPSQ